MNYYILFNATGECIGVSHVKLTPIPKDGVPQKLTVRPKATFKTQIIEGRKVKYQEPVGDVKEDAPDIQYIPEGGIAITDAEQAKYLKIMELQLQNIILVKGKITITDIYTPEQIKERESEAAAAKILAEARTLLRLSDRFESPPYINNMTEIEKLAFKEWRAFLLNVATGKLKVLPETPEFVKNLLEL